jgi:putative phage-type endonuclease
MEQGGEPWLKFRKKGIGSSDAPAIMGVCEYRDPLDVWKDKLGLLPPIKENPAMLLGHKFEVVARARFCLENDIEIDPEIVTHSEFDFLFASLDGCNFEKKIIAEIKYMGLEKWENIRESKSPTPMHMAQIQHQLMVTGYDSSYYICYTLTDDRKEIDKYQCLTIEKNNNYIEELFKRELQFWDLVRNKIAPVVEEKPKGKNGKAKNAHRKSK